MSVNSVKPIASCFLRKITPLNLNGLKYIPAPAKKDFFCKQIWNESIPILRKQYPKRKTSVTFHGEVHRFNHMLTGHAPAETINLDKLMKIEEYPNFTVRDVIYETDIEYKLLEPLKEPLTLYRCIPRRPANEIMANRLFDKAASLKPGDRIMMREYAYFSIDKDYAMSYLAGSNGGILYEITFPTGAQISGGRQPLALWEQETERCSVFECCENLAEGKIQHVKGRYILPEELFG